MKVVRSILGVAAGVLVGGALIAAIEASGHALFPPPAGLDPADTAALRARMHEIPAGSFAILIAAHFLGTLVGAWLAARIAAVAHARLAAAAAGVFLLFGIVNLVAIPHPWWFAIADVVAYAAAGWIAGRLASPAPRMLSA